MVAIILGVIIGVAAVFGTWCDINGWREEHFQRRVGAGAAVKKEESA